MATFNAIAGQAKVIAQIDDVSDEIAAGIAALEDDPTLNNKIVAAGLNKVNDIVNDRDAFMAFAADTHTLSSGQPAKALGTGTPTSSNSVGDAWETIKNAGTYTPGQIAATQRIINTADPAHIKVDANGTPVEVAALNTTVSSLTTERNNAIKERDALEQKLKDANDPKVIGSLAQQLGAEKAKKTPANLVDKTKLAPKVTELKKKVTALSDIHRPGTPSKKTEILAAVDEIIDLVK